MQNTDWETIYRQYKPKVSAYVHSRVSHSEDAEDLCSEIFLKVLGKQSQFSGNPKALSSWIYMITKRCVVDYYRSRRIHCEIPEELQDETDLESHMIDVQALEDLAEALEKLDQRLREIILLHYYSGNTLKEIAVMMDMSYPNAKLLHRKALNQLRSHFE